jgi:hypothetical protein
MSQHLPLRCALASVLATIFVSPAFAQSVTLDFTNTDLPPIKLLDTSTVGIDANGNLTAECVLDGATCEGISTGSGTAPSVALSRNNGSGDITAGQQIGLTWAVQNAPELCQANSSPAVNGWNGNLVSSTGGSQLLTLSTVGAYTFGIKCYNGGGASEVANVAATVVQGSGGVIPDTIPACTEDFASHPNVQPAGFTGSLRTWSQLFFGAEFPEGKSHLSPIGSFSLASLQPATRGPTMNARYITTPFIPGPNSNYQISWLGAQAITAANYNPPRAADLVFVSISPCAGDLRKRYNTGAPSILESGLCRGMASNGSIKFGTNGLAGQCPLVAGQTYFINIAMVNTNQEPLSTTTTTCASGEGNRCEANFDGL